MGSEMCIRDSSGPDISSAQGPALLYAANLLGILIGGITVLAIREPYFRDKLRRRRRSRLPVLLALGLIGFGRAGGSKTVWEV